MKTFRYGIVSALLLVLNVCQPVGAQFVAGNIVVERAGGTAAYGAGSAALSGSATAMFVDQFLPTASGQTLPVNTLALPTTATGNNLILTDSGSSSSNGYLARSVDGQSLLVGGYNAALGTATVASTNPATVNRTVGVVNAAGTINTLTGINNGPSNNFRSVASVDAASFYTSASGSGTVPTAGIQYVPPANVNTVAAAATITNGNFRNIAITNSSLFASANTTTGPASPGIYLIGTAGTLPTSAAGATLLTGTDVASSSPYGFALVSNSLNANNYVGTGLNTLYLADDSTSAAGGLSRWEFNGTTWVRSGTITFGPGIGARGLTVQQSGSIATLLVTTSETAANRLVQLTDNLALAPFAAASPITLATAPANTAFRGVAFAPVPVPEPAAVLALAACVLGTGGYVRRRVRG